MPTTVVDGILGGSQNGSSSLQLFRSRGLLRQTILILFLQRSASYLIQDPRDTEPGLADDGHQPEAIRLVVGVADSPGQEKNEDHQPHHHHQPASMLCVSEGSPFRPLEADCCSRRGGQAYFGHTQHRSGEAETHHSAIAQGEQVLRIQHKPCTAQGRAVEEQQPSWLPVFSPVGVEHHGGDGHLPAERHARVVGLDAGTAL
jgi:hypothetical protein